MNKYRFLEILDFLAPSGKITLRQLKVKFNLKDDEISSLISNNLFTLHSKKYERCRDDDCGEDLPIFSDNGMFYISCDEHGRFEINEDDLKLISINTDTLFSILKEKFSHLIGKYIITKEGKNEKDWIIQKYYFSKLPEIPLSLIFFLINPIDIRPIIHFFSSEKTIHFPFFVLPNIRDNKVIDDLLELGQVIDYQTIFNEPVFQGLSRLLISKIDLFYKMVKEHKIHPHLLVHSLAGTFLIHKSKGGGYNFEDICFKILQKIFPKTTKIGEGTKRKPEFLTVLNDNPILIDAKSGKSLDIAEERKLLEYCQNFKDQYNACNLLIIANKELLDKKMKKRMNDLKQVANRVSVISAPSLELLYDIIRFFHEIKKSNQIKIKNVETTLFKYLFDPNLNFIDEERIINLTSILFYEIKDPEELAKKYAVPFGKYLESKYSK